jgi:hypothetical protein
MSCCHTSSTSFTRAVGSRVRGAIECRKSPLRLLLIVCVEDPYDEVDDDRNENGDSHNVWASPIIKPSLSFPPYRLGSPVVGVQGVRSNAHSDENETGRRIEGSSVAKVHQTNTQSTEDNGEVEPRKEGSFIGKEDLGLDPGGKSNTLVYTICMNQPSKNCIRLSTCKGEVLNAPAAVWSSGWLDIVTATAKGTVVGTVLMIVVDG